MLAVYKKNKILFGLLILFMTLRLVDIGNDITNSDAARWHRRSVKFLNALKQDELESTYQHYQPGVTLMWLNSVVKHTSLKTQENAGQEVKTLEHAGYYPTLHGTSKAVMVGVLGILFILQFLAISKLFNRKTAILYGLLVATEPYLIGIDRWFHLTSFETFFAFTSFLMLMLWKNTGKKHLLTLSAVLFSLAVYSKLTAAITAIALLVVFLTAKKRKHLLKSFLTFSAISLGIFVLLLPALWVEPGMVIEKFYSAVVNAVGNDIRYAMLTPLSAKLFYPLVLSFKLSPFTLALFAAAILNVKAYKKDKNAALIIVYFVVYFAGLSLADKKIDRYALALIPPALLLGAYHLQKLKLLAQVVFLTLSVTFTIWVISVYHPVYSAYYSPAFGGPQNALDIGIFENSGEYFAQAAQYLNKKEDKPLVAVPNNTDAFAFHYKGPVTTVEEGADYIVWSHDIDRPDRPIYDGCRLEKSFTVQKFSYLHIYSCIL